MRRRRGGGEAGKRGKVITGALMSRYTMGNSGSFLRGPGTEGWAFVH